MLLTLTVRGLRGRIAPASSAADANVVSAARRVEEYIEKGSSMPERADCRPVQITIHADDVAKAVAFCSAVFDAEFIEAISSFQFGGPILAFLFRPSGS